MKYWPVRSSDRYPESVVPLLAAETRRWRQNISEAEVGIIINISERFPARDITA